MLELLAGHQEDKYDILLDKIHALIMAKANDDHSSLFNEIVDFLFENFCVNKSTTTFMSLDIERIDRESLLVLNSTNLVYGIINGLVRFYRDRLDVCLKATDGFKKFSTNLGVAT